MSWTRSTFALGGLSLASLLFVANCAINPVPDRQELAQISEAEELEVGARAAIDVSTSLGLYPDARMQQYVTRVGEAIAGRTKRAALPWAFFVLDDPTINAFALPGGHVFVTRGMLSALTSEAQLAAVLGHESGHVAARHGVQQMRQQRISEIGLGLMSSLSPALANHGELEARGVGLLLLKNSRDHETQADKLGFWYAVAEGYDARAMVGLMEVLDRESAREGRGRLPEWQSTHPDPEDRIRDLQHLVVTSTHDFEAMRRDGDQFLRRLDGMPFGVDPRAGFFRGARFLHPGRRFTMLFPDGWRSENANRAVSAVSDDNDGIVHVRVVPGSAAVAARRFFAQDGVESGDPKVGRVNGNPSVTGEFMGSTPEGQLRGLASFIEFDGQTWALMAVSTAARYDGYAVKFGRSLASFERLTDPADLAVQPMRIEITDAPKAMTLREFDRIRPSVIPIDELALINGLKPGSRLTAGQLVKRVIGDRTPMVSGREGTPR